MAETFLATPSVASAEKSTDSGGTPLVELVTSSLQRQVAWAYINILVSIFLPSLTVTLAEKFPSFKYWWVVLAKTTEFCTGVPSPKSQV